MAEFAIGARIRQRTDATYTGAQLTFAALASLVLWGTFVFVQTVRHRDYFLPLHNRGDEQVHAPPPSVGLAWASFGLLLVALTAVVGLAKLLLPSIESAVAAAGAPKTMISVAIALLVLLPETTAALRAARANRLQTSLNLAMGSALASIGLTIPAVAFTSMLIGIPLVLGLDCQGPDTTAADLLRDLDHVRIRAWPRDDGGGTPGDLHRLSVSGVGALRRSAHERMARLPLHSI